MIDKLEVGQVYKLIDKTGYMQHYYLNKDLYHKYFNNDCVTIFNTTYWGSGLTSDGTNVISGSEFKFFELVQEPSPLPNYTPCDTLTRCQELAAEYNDSRFTVEYKQQVLESLIQLLTTGGNE